MTVALTKWPSKHQVLKNEMGEKLDFYTNKKNFQVLRRISKFFQRK
jgi:hypothetical protein